MFKLFGRASERSRIGSMICRREHFDTDWYKKWSALSRSEPPNGLRFHRKLWEFAAIAEAFNERGCLVPGKKGLCFAAGRERLVSMLATTGVKILATDAPSDDVINIWQPTNEYGGSVRSLFYPEIIDAKKFYGAVSFQAVDMNDPIGPDLNTYDFVWSTCAFEHLGSIEHGLRFFERSMDFLKPGGIAVHTTEYNVSSNADTIETGNTVIYRRQDLERLAKRLTALGHSIEPFDFFVGDAKEDLEHDVMPFYTTGREHIKLELCGYVSTAVLMIARKK